jgi:6-phosphofructokinase 2
VRQIITLTLNPTVDVSADAERVEHSRKIRCTEPLLDPGGGGVNVARVASRLGAAARAVFPAGGSTGDQLCSLLKEERLPVEVLRIPGRTRESLTVNESATGLQYRFSFPGPELSTEEQRLLLERVRALLPVSMFLVVSGSVPPNLDPQFFTDLREACLESQARLVVDSSGSALRTASGKGVYLLKPNGDELADAVGRTLRDEQDELEAGRELIARGWAEVIVVSLAARGALLVTATMSERIPAVPVKPGSAVGAGDSMVAGIVVGLSRDLSLPDAVRLGVAAGAAALATPGTGLARREDIERLYGASLAAPTSGSELSEMDGGRVSATRKPPRRISS